MSKYQSFIFDHFDFDPEEKTLSLHYSVDDTLNFTEVYRFDFEFEAYDPTLLHAACETLFLMAGISYYKAFIPAELVVRSAEIDQLEADFFSKTFQKGLGEFWYMNKLDPQTPVRFPASVSSRQVVSYPLKRKAMVAIGGGKDSLVSVELLRNSTLPLETWSVGHTSQLAPLVATVGLPHAWVERTIDPLLLELNAKGALNGHIPISAVIACVGTIVATLRGASDIVVSNEHAANEPTLEYQGILINHQYSKSQEFEQDFQKFLLHRFGETFRFYSLLRPLSELRIAQLFSVLGFEKYKAVFSSCNRAFTQDQSQIFWCGECPKCAFVAMVLSPYIEQTAIEGLFSGKNLLTNAQLENTYKALLGIQGSKPLECVGEIRESRAAMDLCQKIFPALGQKYKFEIDRNFDFTRLDSDEIPDDIRSILLSALAVHPYGELL